MPVSDVDGGGNDEQDGVDGDDPGGRVGAADVGGAKVGHQTDEEATCEDEADCDEAGLVVQEGKVGWNRGVIRTRCT